MHLFLASKLAWSNTTANLQRLFVRCSGVTFAVVLMFMQTGFRNALFDSNVRIMEEKISADVVIRTKSRFMLSSGQQMPLQIVISARSCKGVAIAEPIYIENVLSDFRRSGNAARKIRVLGFDPENPLFENFGLASMAAKLKRPMTAAADVKSKLMFDLPVTDAALAERPFAELVNKNLELVGLFQCGINFSNDGTLAMTTDNFAKYFSLRGGGDPLSQVDYGVIRCEGDADPVVVAKRLQQMLGENVIAETRVNFLASERNFWGKNTPIGLIFWVGTLIGFVVGLIICYQVLATDIGDHMGEFATLKAMGYPTTFFTTVVVVQALLLSLVSFVPGLLISLSAFSIVNVSSGLIMFLNLQRTASVLGLTVAMCVISGIIALRKLLSADPASLF